MHIDIVLLSTLSLWLGGACRTFLRDARPVCHCHINYYVYTRCIEGKLMRSIRSGTRGRNIILRKFWAKVMLARGAWRKWWFASSFFKCRFMRNSRSRRERERGERYIRSRDQSMWVLARARAFTDSWKTATPVGPSWPVLNSGLLWLGKLRLIVVLLIFDFKIRLPTRKSCS